MDKARLSGKLTVFTFLLVLAQTVLAQTEHTLPLVMAGSNQAQEGLVRIINHSERAGTVDIVAIDDTGERFGPITLSLDALEAVNLEAVDLEEGNMELNLSGGVGDGEGNWHLELDTTLDIEALAYIRSVGGFLNTVHDVVADDGSLRYYVPTFNPSYRSLLRLVNQADTDTEVTITGRDDEGGPAPEGEVRLTLPPYAACTVTALELESGEISSDCPSAFSGSFGNGTRKWRLLISADHPLQVLSLLKSSTGEQIANLSASAPGTVYMNAQVYTQDEDLPRAQSFVTRGDRFAFVGSTEDALQYAAGNGRVVDLQGRSVMPGIIDAHTHPGLVAISGDLSVLEVAPRENEQPVQTDRMPSRPKEATLAWLRGVT